MDLYREVCRHDPLMAAWHHVRKNGRLSTSLITREQVDLYDRVAHKEIKSLSTRLGRKTFKFQPEFGYRQPKPNGDWRPVVVGTLSNRVVRRTILDTLQVHDELKPYFENPHSFGGVVGKGVAEAVLAAKAEIDRGAQYCLTSDISSFFTAIPTDRPLQTFEKVLGRGDLLSLLEGAINTELSNLAALEEDAKRFPLEGRGVAQGSCLSPLIGNILLHTFDSEMNTRDVRCFRYIDDFLLLGPSRDAVHGAFKRALRILREMGLTAYRPGDGTGKAACGLVRDGFSYLGAEFTREGFIRPSKDSRDRMRESLVQLLSSSESAKEETRFQQKLAFADTIKRAHLICQSWVRQYSFCTDKKYFQNTERSMNLQMAQYAEAFIEQVYSEKNMYTQNAAFGFKPFG